MSCKSIGNPVGCCEVVERHSSSETEGSQRKKHMLSRDSRSSRLFTEVEARVELVMSGSEVHGGCGAPDTVGNRVMDVISE